MSRAPFQILVFLRRVINDEIEYLLLRRADSGVWQGIAGGGEDDEGPEDAATRETLEETGGCTEHPGGFGICKHDSDSRCRGCPRVGR